MIRKIFLLLALLVGAAFTAIAAPQGNPLVFGNNRLTLITPTLFRLEYAKDGHFVDAPTLFAYQRNNRLDTASFTVRQVQPDVYEIRTSALRIVYRHDGYPFSTANLSAYFMLDGKEKKFTNRFILRNNLGGPVETLDRVTHEIPMNDGLLSKDGWYIIDDAQADLLVNGWLQSRNTANNIQDQYCFVYGNDYRSALKSLGTISGFVPMTRKYVHGIWYCKYWDYTSDDFLNIIKGYDEHNFPLDNMVFDMAWHTNDATEGTGHNGHLNWTGYTWNTKLIPNPAALIDAIHKQGITVSLNDHPHDGLRPHEQSYAAFAKAMPPDTPKPLLFNPADSVYMKNFFLYAHKPSEQMGVDFWWLDWQQNYLYPYVAGTRTTTLAWLNELYFRNSRQNNRRGCGYSRWAGWGDHRHPIQFSGDAQANWEMLAFEVKLTAASGNGGCYFWAHDIGGFRGAHNPELTVRWTQFGVLSAALRVHSTRDAALDRRPWMNQPRETQALRAMYHLRSRLIPYIYSSVWQTHSSMVPLNRGMYIDYGMQKQAFENPQQFMYGDLVLAAPITTAGQGDSLVATQKVWFPKGETWYDFFSHRKYKGNQTLQVAHPLSTFPMYIKGGWLLPMQPYRARPTSASLTHLVLRVYPADGNVADNTYQLYEDDGVSQDYERGHYAITQLTYMQHGSEAVVRISPSVGRYASQPAKRVYTIELPCTKVKTAKVNGRNVPVRFDASLQCPVVDIAEQDVRQTVTVAYRL